MLNIEGPVRKKLSTGGFHAPLQGQATLSELFHENTKLSPLGGRAYGQHVAGVLRSPVAQRLMESPYKVYSLMDQVALAPTRPQTELEKTIVERRSRRRFTGAAVSLDELSRLLFFAYGRTGPDGRSRAVASGGALYPLEIYVVPHRVDGLDPGVYHYNVEHHCLDAVTRGDQWARLKECVWMQDMKDPDEASLVLFVTAIFQRSTFKYLDRGYRLILLEAGEVAQNLGLLVTALGLGGYLLGGFLDNHLSALLGIDGVEEAPLFPMVVGRPRSSADGGAA